MDGLLVDSERLERRSWQAAAADHGVELDDARFGTFVGHPADEGERMLARYYGAAFDVAAFRASCHRHLRALVAAEGVALRPGALAWLRLVADRGLPLALATSSGPARVRERLGELLPRFAAVVTRADVARGKPFPDLYLEAAARLGVAPADCLALEDSPTGARAALAAGMPVVVVPDLVAPPDDLRPRLAGVYDSLDAVRAAAVRAWDAAGVGRGGADLGLRDRVALVTATGGEPAPARATDRACIENRGSRPITVIVSPAALEHLLVPGGSVIVEAVGPAHPAAGLLVERSCDTAVVTTWAGARARLLAPDGGVIAVEEEGPPAGRAAR